MDLKQIVQLAVDEYTGEMNRALDGLTPEERRYQPTPEANHIDFLVWHIARVEDYWVRQWAKNLESIWVEEGWHEQFGLSSADGGGYRFTAEQVTGLPEFDPDDLLAYSQAVRKDTVSYLEALTDDDFTQDRGSFAGSAATIPRMLAHLIVEESQHGGQIAYIRGMQRGIGSERPESIAVDTGGPAGFRPLLRAAIDEYTGDMHNALEGLTTEERRHQPTLEANHIDYLVWHIARVEDRLVNGFARQKPDVWEEGAWHEKLGLPEEGSGFGYSGDQVRELPNYDLGGVLDYFNQVREGTVEYLDSVTPEDLDLEPSESRGRGFTVGRMFSHLVVEESQHVGQIAYIRGILRGINK